MKVIDWTDFNLLISQSIKRSERGERNFTLCKVIPTDLVKLGFGHQDWKLFLNSSSPHSPNL